MHDGLSDHAYVPGEQSRQSEINVDPDDAACLPLSQTEHSELPTLSLYLPATHAVHVPPLGPEKPALQMQSVCLLLASGELEFDRHP